MTEGNYSVTHTPVSMPPQHLSSTKKGDAWGRNCVLAIKSMATTVDDMGRTSRENKEINYDLVNSKFREEDFDYVLNPYGMDMNKYGGTPTKMQMYNIIRSRLETLRGEEMNSSLDFFAYAVSGEAVSAKKQKRKDMLRELMKAQIRMEFSLDAQIEQLEQQITQIQGALQTLQDQQQLQQAQDQLQQLQQQRNSLPDIQSEMKKFNSEYVDPVEQTNNKILQFLKRHDKLGLTFNQGWFHALVSAEEVYYTGIKNGHPSARVVNPLQFDYDKGANTTFIHEGNWAKEEYWKPIGEIISEYGDVLTDAQVKKISNGHAGHSYMQGGLQQGFAYSFDGGQRRSNAYGVSTHGYIMKCAWRSYAKRGLLRYLDPRTGKWEETEVDDTFKMPDELKEQGAQLTWEWEDEIWEGTLIGSDIFVNIRRKGNQTKNLPYFGYVYNNINSVATSPVDLVKPHQYTYIVVWYRLEQELAKAKGRKFIMDLAQLPKSHGWDVDQWMYYFENLGVIWINSKEEGRKGDPSTVADFNQFTSIDMSLSQVVAQYMQVLTKLEGLVEDILGVSPQRMGDIAASETATGAQTSISRSTNVTRPLFYFHDLVKEGVMEELLELAKIAYIDGAEMEMVLDEFEVSTLKVHGGDLNGSTMGVFLTNSFEDRKQRDMMEQLLTMAVQQGNAKLKDVATVLSSDSMSYIKSKLDEADRQAAEREQSAAQQQSKDAQAKIEADERKDLRDKAHEKELKQMEIDADLVLKKIDVGSTIQPNDDLNAITAVAQASLDERRHELEVTKEENRKAEKARELSIKESEIKQKKNESTTKN